MSAGPRATGAPAAARATDRGGRGLAVEGLTVRVGGFTLADVALTVEPGRTLVVLGPSGAGKSVLLETLAGFHRARDGRIQLAGRDITHEAPEDRHVGLVFQDFVLFPHLSVLENVRFGLRSRGRRDLGAAEAMLRRLGIATLAGRRPATLSGGERQRVALARALVVEPRLLLFDEPLSALDMTTRDDLRRELRAQLARAGIPAIYVTHDQAEALAMGDDLAVLIDGGIRQVGVTDEVLHRPVTASVARFLGMHVLGPARPDGAGAVQARGVRLVVPAGAEVGGGRVACYRLEDVHLHPAGTEAPNAFPAQVAGLVALGPLLRVTLAGPLPLEAIVFHRQVAELGLRVGARVAASLPPDAIHLARAD